MWITDIRPGDNRAAVPGVDRAGIQNRVTIDRQTHRCAPPGDRLTLPAATDQDLATTRVSACIHTTTAREHNGIAEDARRPPALTLSCTTDIDQPGYLDETTLSSVKYHLPVRHRIIASLNSKPGVCRRFSASQHHTATGNRYGAGVQNSLDVHHLPQHIRRSARRQFDPPTLRLNHPGVANRNHAVRQFARIGHIRDRESQQPVAVQIHGQRRTGRQAHYAEMRRNQTRVVNLTTGQKRITAVMDPDLSGILDPTIGRQAVEAELAGHEIFIQDVERGSQKTRRLNPTTRADEDPVRVQQPHLTIREQTAVDARRLITRHSIQCNRGRIGLNELRTGTRLNRKPTPVDDNTVRLLVDQRRAGVAQIHLRRTGLQHRIL